ncbi:hypothetical protein ACFYOG_33770 [Streptomyces sp. NPDC007818]|uniref:hypothetical protein n=1 Tax=Streptomyces sp. NPDC007818 TaxID=3364780 RepID=UPI0036BC4688
MIELTIGVVAAACVGWLLRRKQKQRSAAAAAGEPVGLPCMLKWSAQGSRWKPGRLLTGADRLLWQPSWGRRSVALPADLRQAGVRSPSTREGMVINPGSRIVTCDSSDGEVLIAVMPPELDHVIKALERV